MDSSGYLECLVVMLLMNLKGLKEGNERFISVLLERGLCLGVLMGIYTQYMFRSKGSSFDFPNLRI